MCAIVGSFDKEKLKELIKLNTYRGNHSYSLCEYNPQTREITILEKGLGDFNYSKVSELEDGMYYIAHTQAPTTDAKSTQSIHPSQYDFAYLWHNGIIKDYFVKEMQNKLVTNEAWDTELLNRWVYFNHLLDEVDGTFSCLRYSNGLTLFRNEISPMFIDDNFNISSTKFESSRPTPAGEILYMNLEKSKKFGDTVEQLVSIGSFKTKENPYFFG